MSHWVSVVTDSGTFIDLRRTGLPDSESKITFNMLGHGYIKMLLTICKANLAEHPGFCMEVFRRVIGPQPSKVLLSLPSSLSV